MQKQQHIIKFNIMRTLTIISVLILLASCGNKNYEVLYEETSMNVCRLQVKLEKKESETELENIAKELREDRKTYDKLWISFFQPNLLPDKSGNGAWAMASFTPELEVEILGEDQPLIDNENQVTEVAKFPNYPTVMDMLEASGDYTTLETVSTAIIAWPNFKKSELKNVQLV